MVRRKNFLYLEVCVCVDEFTSVHVTEDWLLNICNDKNSLCAR